MTRALRLICTSVLMAAVVATGATETADSPSASRSVERYIRYAYRIENRTAALVSGARFRTLAPLAQSASQRCLEIRASRPFDMATDSLGNRVMTFAFDAIPPYGVRVVSIEARLAMTDVPPAEAPGSPDWLRSDRLIDWRAAEFGEQVPRFGEGAASQTARAIHDWVSMALEGEEFVSAVRSATEALRKRQGDCTDYAVLFAACCRREGIPARVLGGYVCEQDRNLHPIAYHNWAEYHDGTSWRVADPERGEFDERASRFVGLRILGESDGALSGGSRYGVEGDGLEVSMVTGEP